MFYYIILATIGKIVLIVSPLIIAKLIDSAVYFERLDIFYKYVILTVLLKTLFMFIMPLRYFIEAKIETDATAILKKRLISRTPFLKNDEHKKTTVGHLLQLVDDDIENTKSLVVADILDTIIRSTIFYYSFSNCLKH